MLLGRRDFSNESGINILLRAKKSILFRIRGFILFWLGAFAKGTSSKITFGKSPRFMNSKWIRLERNVSFGYLCRIECYSSVEYDSNILPHKIFVGENTSFGDFTHIGAINNIYIGNNVLGASKILIIDHDHGKGGKYLREYENVAPSNRVLISKGEILIEDNVWIGESVTILGGSVIGKGSIIAANAVVNGYVPPYTVYISKNH
jgi:acetyltransferase-like isoleucine patch superfamily enzyme